MATEELIPVVDLRLLSQAELASLSLSSPSAFDLQRCDDVVVPKIDRSVFNESAGSRKQTYSRLRLAPPKSSAAASTSSSSVGRRRSILSSPAPSAATAPSSSAAATDDSDSRENHQIVFFLRQLFSREDPSSQTRITPTAETLTLAETRNVVADVKNVVVVDKDREVLNVNGVAVDVVGLGEKNDPFGEELRRRTEGLGTQEELLGFLTGLDGQWGSRRKKRKIVDAAGFGDVLPRGWKLLLGLRRKEGHARLDCRRYISPSGKQFISCKEVSSYIISLVGHNDGRQPISGQNDERAARADISTPRCAAGLTHQDNITKEILSGSSVTPLSSISADHETQVVLFRDEKPAKAELEKVLECEKCNVTFGDKDAYMQHLLSFHQSVKRRRLGKSIGEGVIIKDGKYECQFCHKSFSERHRYNGHIGNHVRYAHEALPDKITTGQSVNPSSMDVVPSVFSEMDASADNNETNSISESSTSKSSDGLRIDSYCRLQMESKEIDCNRKCSAPKISQETSMSKSVDGQVNYCGISSYKSEEIVETSNITSIKPNACLDAISHSLINVGNAACETSNEMDLSSSTNRSTDGQINDRDMTGFKSEEIVETSNSVGIEPNTCFDSTSPSMINVDNATCKMFNEMGPSGSMVCEIEEHNRELKVGSESHATTLSGYGSTYDIEAYGNGITSTMEEHLLVEVDASGNELESDLGSVRAISDKDAVIESTMQDKLHTSSEQKIDLQSCTITPGNEHTHSIESMADDTFRISMKESVLEEMTKYGNELENCLSSSTAGCNLDAVNDAIGIDDGNALLFNEANLSSSWVQSSSGLPILNMIPITDQGGDELPGIVQKHENISGLEELRLDDTEPSNSDLLPDLESRFVSETPMELGYDAELENELCPSVQLEWDVSLQKMVTSCEFTSVCVWCSREFKHASTNAELQSDSLGFMCPACKAKISEQLNVPETDFSRNTDQL